ncbi:hypothetical protein [Plasmodium yoelii yoelii]|uniref:Uncharacterized protein n=1 Tax=Plasmodium yoelii yoelii TaxID=73239 RepID=Q7REJ0_PLAYO|nr:hypothetical protein [Plasmodium yoelii yoelii]
MVHDKNIFIFFLPLKTWETFKELIINRKYFLFCSIHNIVCKHYYRYL